MVIASLRLFALQLTGAKAFTARVSGPPAEFTLMVARYELATQDSFKISIASDSNRNWVPAGNLPVTATSTVSPGFTVEGDTSEISGVAYLAVNCLSSSGVILSRAALQPAR